MKTPLQEILFESFLFAEFRKISFLLFVLSRFTTQFLWSLFRNLIFFSPSVPSHVASIRIFEIAIANEMFDATKKKPCRFANAAERIG